MTKTPRSKRTVPKSTAPANADAEVGTKSSALGSGAPSPRSSATHQDRTPPKIVKADSYHTIYANYSKVGISQWDISIIFGQTVDSENDATEIEELVSVRFSPQYFKAMANSLTAALRQWESLFGELQDGPGQSANIEGMEEAFARVKDQIDAMQKARGK